MTVPAARENSVNSCRLDQRLIGSCANADRWPLPGHGRTARRFALLIGVARRDLVLGRLVEAHADAVAIAAELRYRGRENGQRWGVWAAGPPNGVLATRIGSRWVLEGVKSWCSGASLVTHALVDASAPDGQRLFAVAVRASGVRIQPASWSGPGMQRSDTRSVAFDRAGAEPVGKPDEYLSRPGFWMGAIGVAACWHGGSRAVARPLYGRARSTDGDLITMAHLGAVHTAISEDIAVLRAAAEKVDRFPLRDHAVLALTVRDTVERNAIEVMDRVGRALGPAPLAQDGGHARTVVDLSVYVRQSHADFDRAEIGRRVSEKTT
jgi:alkylation response protein AidB-like acyl-CoA dehydrogenase